MQYCIDTGKSVTLVDADRTNADVSEVYPNGAKTASFSEDEKKSYDADQIFNLALTMGGGCESPSASVSPRQRMDFT